ncbi:MAG: ABC transporter ATP-binding protein [Desulfomonilaceae bacterium]
MADSQPTTSSEPPQSLCSLMIRLWRHLTKRRQRQLGLLFVLMLASAFSEVISLGAVLPLIAALTNPDKVFAYPLVRKAAEMMAIGSASQLVLPLAVLFAVTALAAGGVRLGMLWVSTRLATAIGSDISMDIFNRTLYQPYSVHLCRNSSEVINGIGNKSWYTMACLHALLTIVSSVLIFLALVLALLSIDPFVISVAALIFGACYASITWLSRRRLYVNSQRMATESTRALKILQEGLGAIRDVLLKGAQPIYCQAFRQADLPYRRSYGNTVFIGASPRFVMEAVGMALIAGLAYTLSNQKGGVQSALPVLGALAIGAQRILPVMQQIYISWVTIAGHQASILDTVNLLDQPLLYSVNNPVPIDFKDAIEFRSVRFRYLPDGPWVFDGINLTIPKGARAGFVGTTGSGKSTTLDLLMGLLEPTEGEILVDGIPIRGERLLSWQRTIAHVPQSIFLADSTIAENIAFGVPRNLIDMERVKEAVLQAQLEEFIESLKNGYQELVGERAVRLSGGQIQRIGIARALYGKATVLAFDEATSSLDNQTEKDVMNSIESLKRDLTVIMIAHRLTTVQHCDIIFELAHGKVVAQGSYEQLLERSPSFRSMARAVA